MPPQPTVIVGTPPGATGLPNIFVDPGAAHLQPIIFEPNPPLTASVNEVWVLASGGANWGGGNVFVSTDGETFKYIGTIYTGGRQGILKSPLSAFSGTNPDPLPDFLSVNLTMSRGQLISASAIDAANSVSLCYCDGELLSYQTANLISMYNYNLVTLYRGLYGTVANAHTTGSSFAYLGLQNDILGVIKYPYPPSLIGTLIYLKVQSFNQYGNVRQSLDECLAFEYTLTGRGSISPVNVPFFYNGIPQSGTPILNYTFGAGDSFPVNFTGSVCTSNVAATASTTFNVSKNGTNFATMIFGISATSAVFSGPAEMFISGDILRITPSRTDATLANLTGNLAGMS